MIINVQKIFMISYNLLYQGYNPFFYKNFIAQEKSNIMYENLAFRNENTVKIIFVLNLSYKYKITLSSSSSDSPIHERSDGP